MVLNIKVIASVLFCLMITGCVQNTPVASSWDESFKNTEEQPVNMNQGEVEKVIDNKNIFGVKE